MKLEKDVLIAIIVGLVVGGVVAFLFFFLPKIFPKTSRQPPVTQEEQLSPPTATSAFLTLENPTDGAIFTEGETLISGKTQAGALVAIVSSVDEAVVETDSEGHFEAEIALEEGANEIIITAYQDQKEEAQSVTLYYTEEEI